MFFSAEDKARQDKRLSACVRVCGAHFEHTF